MNKIFTCIMCPVGCEIEAKTDGQVILEITGANCSRGNEYVQNEMHNPKRTVTSSVRIVGGTVPIASVRLIVPVPKDRMMDVIDELRKVRIDAPVDIGQTIIKNILGLGSDVIITKRVEKA